MQQKEVKERHEQNDHEDNKVRQANQGTRKNKKFRFKTRVREWLVEASTSQEHGGAKELENET